MTTPPSSVTNLPLFSAIKIENIERDIDAIIRKNRHQLSELLAGESPFTWDSLIIPLEQMEDHLDQLWSTVSHLHAVTNSPELHQTYTACLAKLTAYSAEMGHNRKLYQAFLSLKQNEAFDQYDNTQKKVIDNALRDFRLSGVDLPPPQQKKHTLLSTRHSELSNQFEHHVLQATQAWTLLIEDKSRLQGLPEHTLRTAATNAQKQQQSGYLLTLDFPCYLTVMAYCQDTDIRQKMYRAFVTRASDQQSDQSQYDNSAVMDELLAVRLELAKLLGFTHYANQSLVTKMAENPQQVLDFLNQLAEKAIPKARQELAELQQFAQEQDPIDSLQAWDMSYYSEKLKQHLFDIDSEQLRLYFPIKQVLDTLFTIVKQLYGIHLKPLKNVDTWHSEVQCFEIIDEQGQTLAQLYMDLYARENKRSGAWMAECRQRLMYNNTIQQPAAYLVCNFAPAAPQQPALLSHEEVETLFHEFGHCLHHLLTKINYPSIGGINGVAWDAVELPSQFFENFCWHPTILAKMARHYQTGEPLATEQQQKMIAAKQFQSGLFLTRQLVFALFDLELHCQSHAPSQQQSQQLLNDIREKIQPFATPDYNRFQHSFSHIFAGGYAAGYYSYLWAQVLAQDVFSRFEQEGILNATIGRNFLHCILEKGGSQDAMELFVAFRGRKPSIKPLLKNYGIEI